MVWGFCYLRIFKKMHSSSGRSLHVNNEVRVTDQQEPGTSNPEPTDERKKPTTNKCKWTREAIVALINERIKMNEYFKTTTSRSENKWTELAKKLQGCDYKMTATQCNDKWRYLKAKYAQKKDNLGDKGLENPPWISNISNY
jgi:hypothetical protein